MLRDEVLNCKRCALHKTRTNVVFGEGPKDAEIMLVGEAPGRQEDNSGRPFVGAAGKFLTEALNSAGIERKEVYITNVVKCRPPGNRTPNEIEIRTCSPYLVRQIEIIKPKVICALGAVASSFLLPRYCGTRPRAMRYIAGKVFSCKVQVALGHTLQAVLVTYHPAAAIYNPGLKEKIKEHISLLGDLVR
ncbi:MAG: uracil-DNA glycosylase [Thermoplasmata archaeon]|nr:MAG: uracil-DNA glycosylase [Thermoplasmata archaeon]